jgi:chorismate mutase
MTVLETYRDQITALDEQLVATVNARLEQVAALRRYKEENGIAFFDPEREAALVEHLKRLNGGPLTDEGVEKLIRFVLDLVKQEVTALGLTEAARSEGAGSAGAGSRR